MFSIDRRLLSIDRANQADKQKIYYKKWANLAVEQNVENQNVSICMSTCKSVNLYCRQSKISICISRHANAQKNYCDMQTCQSDCRDIQMLKKIIATCKRSKNYCDMQTCQFDCRDNFFEQMYIAKRKRVSLIVAIYKCSI